MRKTAVRIRDLARAYAPRDTGALEKSIDYATTKGANNRNVFTVYIDLDASNPDGHPVGDYAWIMEEQLHPFGRRSGKIHFDLGLGSIAKNATGKVGGKFLKRAVQDGAAQLMPDAILAVKRSLAGSSVNVGYKRASGGIGES